MTAVFIKGSEIPFFFFFVAAAGTGRFKGDLVALGGTLQGSVGYVAVTWPLVLLAQVCLAEEVKRKASPGRPQ